MHLDEIQCSQVMRRKAPFEKKGKGLIPCEICCEPEEVPNIFSVVHETTYKYKTPVHFSNHLFRLQPVSDSHQSLISYKMIATPSGKEHSFTGVFGNYASFLEIRKPYKELKIISQSIVCVREKCPRYQGLKVRSSLIPLVLMPWDHVMLQAYLMPPELPESMLIELSKYAMKFVKRHKSDVYEVLFDINQTIFKDFHYVPGSTTLYTTPYEVFYARKGVCADFANLFICLARLLNIPARYRVGYIYTGGHYESKFRSDKSHAWVEVFLPYSGWIGFDPTNGCLAGKYHIRVASGRHYLDATPSSGTIFKGGDRETLSTSVRVELLNQVKGKKNPNYYAIKTS